MKVKTITCSERGDRAAKVYDANLVEKTFICCGCGNTVPIAGDARHEVQ
jgi:hypothetical protein